MISVVLEMSFQDCSCAYYYLQHWYVWVNQICALAFALVAQAFDRLISCPSRSVFAFEVGAVGKRAVGIEIKEVEIVALDFASLGLLIQHYLLLLHFSRCYVHNCLW